MSIFTIIFAIGWVCGAVTGAGVVRIVLEVKKKWR